MGVSIQTHKLSRQASALCHMEGCLYTQMVPKSLPLTVGAPEGARKDLLQGLLA